MPHVVFAWEIGSGFGHLASMASLGDSFRRRGHRVTAIVPEFSRGREMLASLGIDVAGVPPIPAPSHSSPISVNYTANLLRNGFWHGPTVACRIGHWRDLLGRVKPDLLFCDHAPSALLASRGAEYARASMGTGFTLPPLATPMPSVQPWLPLPAGRLAETDRNFLDVANPPLCEQRLPALETVSSLFEDVDRFLCVEPELDHYPVRPGEQYWGTIARASALPLPEGLPDNEQFVFLFMSATNRFLGPVLDALGTRDIPVVAYIAGRSAAGDIHRGQTSNVRFLSTQIDLTQVAARCRLAVTNGGTQSASLLLKHGARLLICPEDLEKAAFAARLRERKLAYALNWFAPTTESVHASIDAILDSDECPQGLKAFVTSHAGKSASDSVSEIVSRCEARLAIASRQTSRGFRPSSAQPHQFKEDS